MAKKKQALNFTMTQKVNSTLVESAAYDPVSKTLEVKLSGGRRHGESAVYHYHSVPLEVYDDLVNASSVGTYFINNIQNDYDYEAVYP